VKYLLEHGARIAEKSNDGMTALIHAAEDGRLEVVEHLLSSEGGASITETENDGGTALLWAAGNTCRPAMVQWLLGFGGAQITDTDDAGYTVWAECWQHCLPDLLKRPYTKSDDDKYVCIDGADRDAACHDAAWWAPRIAQD
jgi:hypothetical protein